MKTLFLSDFHLGSPLFKSTEVIVDLLMSPEFEEVILVGDIFDTWEDSIEDIYSNNGSVVSAIQEVSIHKPVVFIVGNHDPDADNIRANFPLVGVHEEFPYHGGMVVHGHQFDKLLLKYSWFAKLMFSFHWFFQRILFINIKAFFRNIYYSVSGQRQKKYYTELTLDIEKAVVDKYKSYKFVVMGHTHLPKKAIEGTTKYINCGDWIHNRTYATYDTDTGEFNIK